MSEDLKPFVEQNPELNEANYTLARKVEVLIDGITSATREIEKYAELLTQSLVEDEIASRVTCDSFFSMRTMSRKQMLDYLNNLLQTTEHDWFLLRTFIEHIWASSDSKLTEEKPIPPNSLIEQTTSIAAGSAIKALEQKHGLNPKRRGQA